MTKKIEMMIGALVSAMFVMAAYGEESAQGLDGLFGVKFGKVMNIAEKCATNNVGELAYEYTPEKLFRGFSDYVLFATPITRQVSQIRAVTLVGYDEVDDEMNGAIKILEMKFGKKARSIDDDTKAIVFANNDYIGITKDGRRVIIDACCNRLRDLTKEETAKAEKERYAGDIKVLAMLPGKEDGDDRIYRIDSLFGVKFGESMKKPSEEQNDCGAWVHKFNPPRQFMGCQDYFAFATEKTKKVYMIRAVYEGDEYEARGDQIRRVIESATGRKMRGDDDKENFSMYFGDYFINIEKNSIVDEVIVDFVKISLFTQQEKEHKDAERKAASDDLDALNAVRLKKKSLWED